MTAAFKFERRLAELHIVSARTRALKIFAYTSTTFPKEWSKVFTESFIMELFEFAFHARRVNEICGLRELSFPDADEYLVKFSVPDALPPEKNYFRALDRLVHTDSFIVRNTHAEHRQIFLQSEANISATHVIITADWKKDAATVSLYGVCHCFLNAVLPAVMQKFPDLQF